MVRTGAAGRGVPTQGRDTTIGSQAHALRHPLPEPEGFRWRAISGNLGPWWHAPQMFAGAALRVIRWSRAGVCSATCRSELFNAAWCSSTARTAGAPKGGRGCRDDRPAAEQDPREALGRSRGGYGTKAGVIAHRLGPPRCLPAGTWSRPGTAARGVTRRAASAWARVDFRRSRRHQPRLLRAHSGHRCAASEPT